MNLVEDVFKLAESFMQPKDPVEFVQMNMEKIDLLSQTMITSGRSSFSPPPTKNQLKGIVLELVGSSVNYCYWYGKSTIRPGNASSTTMFELLEQAFNKYEGEDHLLFNNSITIFQQLLAQHRFPLLEQRIKHLDELRSIGEDFCIDIEKNHTSITPIMDRLITLFPGFASDMFLKRASLFFIQLYRRFGWFEKYLHFLHVPADYQIPKMLNHYGCISYISQLLNRIETNKLIPKHSLPECEIRSATILTMRKLCERTGWNIADIDAWLFVRRNDATEPFHLTITTDY
jgi:hypothetical protein